MQSLRLSQNELHQVGLTQSSEQHRIVQILDLEHVRLEISSQRIVLLGVVCLELDLVYEVDDGVGGEIHRLRVFLISQNIRNCIEVADQTGLGH